MPPMGNTSGKGRFSTLNAETRWFRRPQRTVSALGHSPTGMPDVVARQVDVFPAERREMRQQRIVDRALEAQAIDGAL